MCGITAILAFEDKYLLKKCTLEKMSQQINHRGPDDEGYYLNDWIGFGFKRLSIIDISYSGHQPMFDVTRNYLIVFNGEIYNYKTLRDVLIKKNYKFKSNTDTEVLLNSYIEWGTSCLHKLEGMFAFIIYDKLKDEIIVARDHLGIKPLYYLKKNDCYFFGSEVKAFKNISKFELNDKQLYEQFRYAYVSGQNTIFKNIYRVKPGTFMKFNRAGFVTENQYYNVIDTLNEQPNQNLNLEEIKQDIDESILKHTMSDVGYNVQLSGGIDSSYITTVLSKEYKHALHTYSGELELQGSNESKYQKIVSERCNTFHHNYLFKSRDLFDNYEKATWHLDIPMVGQASTFLMLLCQQSRNNSKVILTGEGSDELFGGYESFRRIKINKFTTLDLLQKHDLIIKLIPNASKFRKIKNSIKNIYLGMDQSAYFSNEKFRSVFNIRDENIEYRKSVVRDFDQLVNKIFASFQTSHLNALFERQDKMSMAMSVEARVPFSNHKLFEKINQIPFKKKIKPVPKTLLKKLTKEYYGKSFAYRKKNGFELPLNDWLRDEKGLKPWFSLLTDKTFYERGFYNHKSINSLINRHLNKAEDNSIYLMNIINFEIWHRIFID